MKTHYPGNKPTRLLSAVKPGETVTLAGVNAGRRLNSRLAAMGLVGNVQIKVVASSNPGPLVICVKDCRVALGRGMAQKITVI